VDGEAPLDVAGRVAAAAAHDFNNHLAAIALQTELALGQLGSDDEKLRRRLDGILGSCARARDLTGSLLAFGARRPLHPRSVDVAKAVERVAGRRVPVTVEGAPLVAELDPGALDGALSQLLAGEDVAVSAGGDGDVVELRISHGDRALDDEGRRRFFEPFADVDDELGFAAVYGFVRQSGGTIAVEPAARGGTVIVVRLPRADD
jgi:signal transduction histidine kinase